jgi:hypothetical protein
MPDSASVGVDSGQLHAEFSTYVVLDSEALARELAGPNGLATRDLLEKANRVKQRARHYVGVDTGFLRDHIITRIVQAPGGGYSAEVGAEVDYAWWHHEGNNRGWHGNPFLTNAVHDELA